MLDLLTLEFRKNYELDSRRQHGKDGIQDRHEIVFLLTPIFLCLMVSNALQKVYIFIQNKTSRTFLFPVIAVVRISRDQTWIVRFQHKIYLSGRYVCWVGIYTVYHYHERVILASSLRSGTASVVNAGQLLYQLESHKTDIRSVVVYNPKWNTLVLYWTASRQGHRKVDNWGGGGADTHIFMFTDCKNNHFQRK